MRYVTLPATDLRVSHICLGTGGLGGAIDREASCALLDAFVEAGGTFLDTAHVYSDWIPGERHRSEKTIAHWLRTRGRRDRVIIATKGGHPDLATPLVPRLSSQEIAADLDESLDCLGIDTVDLYWLHRDDPERPVGEIMETLHAQVDAGKARYLGCSNWHHERIRMAQAYAVEHGLHPFVASQVFWSLAIPNPGAFPGDHVLMDGEAAAYYAGANLAVVAYTSQARGFFTKASTLGRDALKPELRRDFENERTLGRLARAEDLARRLGTSVSAVVLAYLTAQPFVSVPIIGPLSLDHLRDSLEGADLILTPEMLRYLAEGIQEKDAGSHA
ncbi:MAG: aldo/keto reductase [Chloroflexota bacterium]